MSRFDRIRSPRIGLDKALFGLLALGAGAAGFKACQTGYENLQEARGVGFGNPTLENFDPNISNSLPFQSFEPVPNQVYPTNPAVIEPTTIPTAPSEQTETKCIVVELGGEDDTEIVDQSFIDDNFGGQSEVEVEITRRDFSLGTATLEELQDRLYVLLDGDEVCGEITEPVGRGGGSEVSEIESNSWRRMQNKRLAAQEAKARSRQINTVAANISRQNF